ncbi:MAG: trehalose-phosphatase [Nitrospiraceae bacterium]|nr:trehalose-phosphatase [Nitrospiraceae bacterium]
MPDYYFERDFLMDRVSRGLKLYSGIALFLDYDGTLTPIQKDPSQCVLTEGLKEQLHILSQGRRVRIAVLSGRTLTDVRKRVGIRTICYGGNHGLDISGPGIRFIHDGATAARQLMTSAKRMLARELRLFEGAWLEDKKYSLSLHFRRLRGEEITALKRAFYKTLGEFPEKNSFSVIRGKKVLELTAVASWDKGKAALMLLDRLGRNWLPVVIGDDLTDETAFEALKKRGITIRVGRSRRTSARFYVKKQGEVERVLALLIDAVEHM